MLVACTRVCRRGVQPLLQCLQGTEPAHCAVGSACRTCASTGSSAGPTCSSTILPTALL